MNISDESEEKKKESVDLLNSEVDKFKDALVNLKYLSQKEDASKKIMSIIMKRQTPESS